MGEGKRLKGTASSRAPHPRAWGPRPPRTRPMVSSLAKLCVHHMRLVRFPFLGLSVVTEAWQVKTRGVSLSGWRKETATTKAGKEAGGQGRQHTDK